MKRKADRDEQRNKNLVLIFFISLLALLLMAIFASASQGTSRHLIPISIVALLAGLIFEGKRLSEKWSTLWQILLWTSIISFIAFIPGKHEHDYSLEDHVAMWPYFFITIFAIASIATHGDKVVPKLSEGITLLQSIAVIYWVVDYGIFESHGWLLRTVLIVVLLPSLYSLFHAFTYSTLSPGVRLTLSIWSSLIMFLFAIDNTYRVYQNEQIETTVEVSHSLYIALQYFLLGVSSIYIVQNLLMLFGFLPGKGTFFNAQYFSEVRQLKREHVQRYSHEQTYVGHSIIFSVLAIAAFGLNYYFGIVPRHVAIWAVFVVVPFAVRKA